MHKSVASTVIMGHPVTTAEDVRMNAGNFWSQTENQSEIAWGDGNFKGRHNMHVQLQRKDGAEQTEVIFMMEEDEQKRMVSPEADVQEVKTAAHILFEMGDREACTHRREREGLCARGERIQVTARVGTRATNGMSKRNHVFAHWMDQAQH
jgi:hypothetical protein